MKNENLFSDLKPEERVKALQEFADASELQKVRRHYTKDEVNQMRDFCAEEGISLMEKEEEFSAIKKEFNTAIKDLKMQIKDALKSIKRGYADSEETVYLIADHDNDEMNAYDSNGIFLYKRKMFPNERQTKIVQMTAN